MVAPIMITELFCMNSSTAPNVYGAFIGSSDREKFSGHLSYLALWNFERDIIRQKNNRFISLSG